MPYSPRERDHLRENINGQTATGDDISDQEVVIRKEVRMTSGSGMGGGVEDVTRVNDIFD